MAVVVSGVALFQGQLSASCTSDLLQDEAPGRSVLGSQVTQPSREERNQFLYKYPVCGVLLQQQRLDQGFGAERHLSRLHQGPGRRFSNAARPSSRGDENPELYVHSTSSVCI